MGTSGLRWPAADGLLEDESDLLQTFGSRSVVHVRTERIASLSYDDPCSGGDGAFAVKSGRLS